MVRSNDIHCFLSRPRGQFCSVLVNEAEAEMNQPAHRSGPLKQSNKSHKHGRHKSKGKISASQKGIIS